MDKTLATKLENARRQLLDLSGRNRLLNLTRRSSRTSNLEIVDEISDQVFRRLVHDRAAMSFLATPETDEADEDAEVPTEDAILLPIADADVNASETGTDVPARHSDDDLQTQLPLDGLQKKLLKLFRDARTFQEEQGVNLLHLSIGFLKWYDADSSDSPRHAPLILVPVALERPSARSSFRIKWTEDDITTNLSLQAKLLNDFGVKLPEIADLDDITPSAYCAAVAEEVSRQKRWEVLSNDMVLSFFSFSKFLMFRDLQSDNWPGQRSIDKHPLILGLLQDGVRGEPPICGDDDNVDRLLAPRDTVHVLDADSSQTIAIEEVKRGRNLVIQGPPGTGKSQTITNIIATAVTQGKKVLFVAEKMAALEVVKRRLDNIDLGDMCLELHSHKANKRAVVTQLERTLALGKPDRGNLDQQVQELTAARNKLNRHAEALHQHVEPAQVKPYDILGKLVQLRAKGIRSRDVTLSEPLTWTAADFDQKRRLLDEFLTHFRNVGSATQHPGRGVRLESWVPKDRDRLSTLLPGIIARLSRLVEASDGLCQALHNDSAPSCDDVAPLADLALRCGTAPQMDRKAFANPVWDDRREDIERLVAMGQTLAACRQELRGVVSEHAWSTDVSAIRRDLATFRFPLLRKFRRSYRQACAAMRSILLQRMPRRTVACLRILDRLMVGQQALRTLREADWTQFVGSRAFGSLWGGPDSAWASLQAILDWDAECRQDKNATGFRQALERFEATDTVRRWIDVVKSEVAPFLQELRRILDMLKFDVELGFGTADLRTVPLRNLKMRLEGWAANLEGISSWVSYYVRFRRLEAEGLGELACDVDRGVLDINELVDQFDLAYYDALIDDVYRRHPELAEFDGVWHEKTLERFKHLDMERIILTRREVSLAHYAGFSTSSHEAGEFRVIREEINKKRKHLPLRKLLEKAGNAVQRVKPVFMMSPSSIAQFLAPGVLEFDLLLIDEASQVQPADALGAIARAKQIVVVGDDQQLPPTRFFQGVTDEPEDADDSGDTAVGDLESVLGLCVAKDVPPRMLRWHYRSKHHSLIAVSNHEFYDNKLFVVPSPAESCERLGLKFRHVPDGVFDRGKSATNVVEARCVADAIVDHAKRFPGKSLGVGTFSVAQRDAILDQLDLRRRDDPSIEPFFKLACDEPFFVKNLENIQGDEREVIFISVGYGRDQSGVPTMNFGPVQNPGGERRLNVLITRARERCEVFSSITADDIDLNRAKSRGAQALKTFLTYAQSGKLDVSTPTDRGFDSEFKRQVAKAVEAQGFEVHLQIGVAGFFIDLAVVDPNAPGRYLLGIECDGATYHSSRSARDRDRLRQMVLEERGWIIHRIWSTDWFQRPDEHLRKVLAAIENAKVEWAMRGTQSTTAVSPKDLATSSVPANNDIPRLEVAAFPSGVDTAEKKAEPYTEASFTVPLSQWSTIPRVPTEQLAEIVAKVVEIEGPVHQDEVAKRVATMWGVQRVGSAISDAIHAALALAERREKVAQSGFFFSAPAQGHQECMVRTRDNVQSTGLRKPKYLPPAEIRGALIAIVQMHLGISREEAIVEAARLFGFRATSQQLQAVIEEQVQYLIETSVVEDRNGKLFLLQPPTTLSVTRVAA